MQRIRPLIVFAILLMAGWPGLLPAQDNDEREGGIVGTGIVGTITELGSIYVNGQHIRFDANLSVTSPLGDRPASSLVPGDTVVVEAAREIDGGWQARSMKAYLPIVGPVAAVAPRRLEIMGALIEIPENAASIADFVGAEVANGDWIAVSGLWRGDVVTASRIEKIAPLPMASVVGTYSSDGASRRVGTVPLLGIDIQHARPLDVLTVQGRPTTVGLEGETVTIGLFTGPVGEVLFEGYLSEPDLEGAYTVQGSGFLAFVANPEMAIDPDRGLFCGSPLGVTTIERVLELPESAGLRHDLLRDFRDNRSIPCTDPPR